MPQVPIPSSSVKSSPIIDTYFKHSGPLPTNAQPLTGYDNLPSLITQAILALNLPTNVKELRRFLGMVQYYRDLWAKRSEMLAPLTDLVGECGQTKVTRAKGTKKVPWHWDEAHQKAFETVKANIAKDVVLAYPDYDKVFEVYTDASSTQLGSVITQSNRPLAFFS